MNDYRRGYEPKMREPWNEEQIAQIEECEKSLNLNDGPNFSEKEYIANLALTYANGAGITAKQSALLLKIYNRRVLCISERPKHEQ